MSTLQPPPTYADILLTDPQTKKTTFNPIWLSWFLAVVAQAQAATSTKIQADGSPLITNNVKLASGTNVTLVESGQTITVNTDTGLTTTIDLPGLTTGKVVTVTKGRVTGYA
jgi:hypothetical protein